MPRARHNRPTAKDRPVKVMTSEENFDGHTYRVDVYVDWVAIIRTLGGRAARNKHGRATLMYGSIIVRTK